MHADPANRNREAAPLLLLRELDLGVGNPAEVPLEAAQLALGGRTHLLPQTVGTVVQDDPHNPSICPEGLAG
jgi:hypothetical protein